MSKLDELIQELCPDGVEFKTADEIFNIRCGYTPSKNKPEFWANGTIPWFRMEDIRENGHILSDSIQHINVSAVKGEPFEANSIIVATSATIGEHALITVPSVSNQRFTYLTLRPEYKPLFDIKFIFYYCFNLDTWCKNNVNEGNFASVDMKRLAKFKFPVPPLEVQREIVRILDNFTELTARKQQFSYYRRKLLEQPKNSAKMVALSEVGKWGGGKTPSMANKAYWENGTIPWISSKDMKAAILEETEDHITEKALDEAGMSLLPEGVIAIVTRSGILKHTFPVAYVPFQTTVNQDIKALVVKEGISSKYAFHAIQAYADDIRVKTKKQGGTVDSLDFQKVLDYRIPLPPLDIQNRLAEVLDNFQAICTDLKIGLPAEIEARQKQYEFYRDKLLTFAATGDTIAQLSSARA